MRKAQYTFRYVAQLTIECATPLAVGSGESSFLTDAQVATDCNGMPYIPGSAIAGVVRHTLTDDKILSFWGKHDRGSQIIFSEARMIGEEGKVLDGLQDIPYTPFYDSFRYLPIRQHTAITEYGVAKEHCKFDEQVVPKGTRFCFEIEMLSSNEEEYDTFKQVLNILNQSTLRFGSGTRNGFGKINVVCCTSRKFNLSNPQDLTDYMHKSSALSNTLIGDKVDLASNNKEAWTAYHLSLEPVDFFMFGSGYGDEEVDDVPVKEQMIEWVNGKPHIKEGLTIVPATSLKGALTHRVAYYYNKQVQHYADQASKDERDNWVGTKNDAVAMLFGEDLNGKSGEIKRGNVLFEDIFISNAIEHIFPHVKIDRFTGGTIDGALFQEKASMTQDKIEVNIYVHKCVSPEAQQAFESALNDLCHGALPLGGNVNKGHGCFEGQWTKE